jgi:hypothetical protein
MNKCRILRLKKYGEKKEGTGTMVFIAKRQCSGTQNYRKDSLSNQIKMLIHSKIYHIRIDI